MHRIKKLLTVLLAAVLFTSFHTKPVLLQSYAQTQTDLSSLELREGYYTAYLEKYKDAQYPTAVININGSDFKSTEAGNTSKLETLEQKNNVLKWQNNTGSISAEVTIPEEGLYTIRFLYYPLDGKGKDIQFGLQIDGEYPFKETETLSFTRAWEDSEDASQQNLQYNVRPKQVEKQRWMVGYLRGYNISYDEELQFYLTQGLHSITLTAGSEPFALGGVTIQPPEVLPTYSQYIKSAKENDFGGFTRKVQAEIVYERSHTVLYPLTDRTNSAVEPSSPYKIMLNTIGGYNWKYPGQWISWKFEVPKDGYYIIYLKAKQNFLRGLNCTRRLYIDGKVPFQEANNIKFPYHYDWYIQTVGDEDTPYLFYLTAGKHTLTLETVLGDIAASVRAVEESTYRLNDLYRRIIMITGANPDPFQDYYLEDEIPDLLDTLKEVKDSLKKQADYIEEHVGASSSGASTLNEVAARLESFLKAPDSLPVRLEQFRESVTSLSAWSVSTKEQPIQLDYIVVATPDQPSPKANSSFFKQFWFDIQCFIASFTVDYNTIGQSGNANMSIDVWAVAAGRDQLQIVKNLIDGDFTPNMNIGVNLSLVTDTNVLTQAILGGKGPDAAIMVAKDVPVNYACRGALVDLTKFDATESIVKEFYASSLIPYQYNGGLYAFPETQSFQMMFVRTDIFKELNISIPETWDEFYKVIPFIQRRNMNVGIPSVSGNNAILTTFETLLFQNKGKLYSDDLKSCNLNSNREIQAFEQWTSFYTDYGLPLEFDFFTRFRSGEMPLGISNLSFYNQLSVAAPEIRNLWKMTPLPGYRQDDGSIFRPSGSTGNSCILLSSSKKQSEAYSFLKWWVSRSIQAQYGTELENTMGPMARYETANRYAFDELPWPNAEASLIREQWEQVQDVPQLPGSYFTSRNISFAFRAVVYKNQNTKEVLRKYTQEIDSEISRKRLEFGLD